MFKDKTKYCLMENVKKNYNSGGKGPVEYYETDLEEALEIVGVGKYHVLHCALMVGALASAILEIIGNAFILPAAACDLELPDNLRGIITSVPNIGVIVTAPLWGRLADSLGRKPTLLVSSAVAGVVALAAAFTTSVTSYAVCKFFASLFLACPSSLGWAYIGEMLPRNSRDSIMLICNGFLMLSSTLSPAIAWGTLSYEWSYSDGTAIIKSWRLLTAAYAIPLLIVSVCLLRVDESPKYLMSRDKKRQALNVVRKMYATNSGLPEEHFCVTGLRSEDSERMETNTVGGCVVTKWKGDSALALLRPPHIKWLLLTGFLMFGLFSLLNGLFLLAPDTINKVMSAALAAEEGTICILIGTPSSNETLSNPCIDTISHETFIIMVTTTLVYSVVVIAASLSPVNKQTLLVGMFATVAVACLTSGLQSNRMVAGVAMSALQLTALGIGPLTAYAVHLFPTSLRGTAVGAVLMFGRLGSVVGANAAGYFLSAACTGTFYGFSALLFFCAALSFLLPKHHSPTTNNNYIDTDDR